MDLDFENLEGRGYFLLDLLTKTKNFSVLLLHSENFGVISNTSLNDIIAMSLHRLNLFYQSRQVLIDVGN